MANQTLSNFDGQDVDLSQMPEGHHMQIDYCDPDVGKYAVFHLTFGESAKRNRYALLRYLIDVVSRDQVRSRPDHGSGAVDFYCGKSWACLGSASIEHTTADDHAGLVEEMLCRYRAMAERQREQERIAGLSFAELMAELEAPDA